MTAGSLRLCLVLAVLLRGFAPLAVPAGTRGGLDETKQDALLYLQGVPRPAVAPQKKAPQFMLDYFNAVSVTDGTPKSQTDILKGNTVRSFDDKGETGEGFHFFNLSSFGKEETMVKAEFRWFRKKRSFYPGKSRMSHFYRVDLYEVLDHHVRPWRGNLITSRLVPLYTQGWEVFTVTEMVSKWIQNSQENNGMLVVTTLPSGNWMESVVYSPRQTRELTDTTTYLVIFSNDRTTAASNQSSLGQSQLEPAEPEHQHHRSRKPRASSDIKISDGSQACKRTSLLVNFEEIGWSGWIISPIEYNAFHCTGSCTFPLGLDLRPTNHATVRSIMQALKVSTNVEVAAPCCVPDSLQSMSILYFDDEANVVLKEYEDMMALSCGCH